MGSFRTRRGHGQMAQNRSPLFCACSLPEASPLSNCLCHQTAAWDCSLALLHERDWLTTRESTPVRGPCRLPWSCTSVLLLVVNLIRITRHPSLLLCQMKCCI
ncbi:unnamed protein product [Musa textilis]